MLSPNVHLPHLAQVVLLDRGQAWPVLYFLHAEQRALLHRDPTQGQQLSPAELLSLAPMEKVIGKLSTLYTRDQGPAPATPRPHRLKLSPAELTTVRLYYARMLASAAAHPDSQAQLAAALGKFHQPSLNLEQHIKLPIANRLESI